MIPKTHQSFLCTIALLLSINLSFAQTNSSNFTYNKVNEPVICPPAPHVPFCLPITSEIRYTSLTHFRNTEARDFFKQALSIDANQQKIETELVRLRQEYVDNANTNNQKYIGDEILKQEHDSYALLQKSKELKAKANQIEYDYWSKASEEELNTFVKQFMPKPNQETLATITAYKNGDYQQINPAIYNKKIEAKRAIEKQVNNNPVYKIQVARYKTTPKAVETKLKKLGFIRRIDQQVNSAGETIYTVGSLGSYEEAKQMQAQIEKEGFSKTKVIAFVNEIEIQLDQLGNPMITNNEQKTNL